MSVRKVPESLKSPRKNKMVNLEIEVSGYKHGNSVIRRGTELAAATLTRQSFSNGSREHLQEAVTLWEAGNPTWIWSKHESDADVPLVGVAFRNGGFPEFSEEMVVLMGNKVLDKRVRGVFARSYPHVPVPQEGCSNRNKLLSVANKAIPQLLEKGKPIFVFPEGTRSRDGVLGDASPTVAHYLNKGDVVFPMVIEGARDALPVEELPRFFKEITFHFGKPILVADLMAEIQYYEITSGEKINKVARNKIITDLIMRRGIAPLVAEEKRGSFCDINLPIRGILYRNA